MTNATDRLEKLEAAVLAEQQGLAKSIRNTLITFGVLVVIVLFYTAWAYNQINSYIGPEGLKTYGEQTVNLIVEQPGELIRQYDANKEEWAELIVNEALKAVPQAEEFLKVQMDRYADQISLKLRKEFFPELNKYLRESAPALKAKYADAKKTKPELTPVQFLCDTFIEFLDEELRQHVIDFDAAAEKANKLSAQLYYLQKKDGPPITREEVAERKILINFILIAKLGPEDSPCLEEFHKFLQERLGVESRQVQEDKVLPDVEGADGDAEDLK